MLNPTFWFTVLALIGGIWYADPFGHYSQQKIEHIRQDLLATWQNPSFEDQRYYLTFMGIVATLEASDDVKQKLSEYRKKFNIEHPDELKKLIFLLRKKADASSLFAGIDAWQHLNEDTKEKIAANVGKTYKIVAEDSVAENERLADIILKAKGSRAKVEQLPKEFRDVINALTDEQLPKYLNILHSTLLNTIAVRKYLNH